MKKIIIPIVLFLLPFMLGFSVMRIAADEPAHISTQVFYDYVLTFPSDSLSDLTSTLGNVANIGFADSIAKPDFSGGIKDDTNEILRVIGEFFSAIWDYIKWLFETSFALITFSFSIIGWFLSLPTFIIRY